jgi:hypothetical protein
MFDIFGRQRQKLLEQLTLALSEVKNLDSQIVLLKETSQIEASLLEEKVKSKEKDVWDLDRKWEVRYAHLEAENNATLSRFMSLQGEYEASHLEARRIQITLFEEREKSIGLSRDVDALQIQLDTLASEKELMQKKYSDLESEKERINKRQDTRIDFLEQENHLLMLQIERLQEEVTVDHTDSNMLAVDNAFQKARWERLVKALPGYIDHGSIRINAIEEMSRGARISWHVSQPVGYRSDCAESTFHILIEKGYPGIEVELGNSNTQKLYRIFPHKLIKGSEDWKLFQTLSASDWKQLRTLILILDQAISQQWRGISWINEFDPNFWQDSLVKLIKAFKALPKIVRYDMVSLKNELQNVDYEHLWLELHGVSFGFEYIPKLEMRIGAALTGAEIFSRHPKFEFPLVDGIKPMSSWYEESRDDFGAKYELRFALEGQAIDMQTLGKLSPSDQALVLNLISLAPQFLAELMDRKTVIKRPWITWMSFAKDASELLKNYQASLVR